MPIVALPQALDASVERLPDIGPKNSKLLARLGIKKVRDLLLTLPYGWEAYGDPVPISSITPGSQATVVGEVQSIEPKITKYKRMRVTEATVEDNSGGALKIAWFNDKFIYKQLRKGDRIAVAGTVKSGFRGALEMQNPYHERIDGEEAAGPKRIGGFMPKYHLVGGLTSRKVARWVDSALPLSPRLEEVLPDDVRERNKLLTVGEAVRKGHRPDTFEDFEAARKRMAFAELFELQAAFAVMRAGIATEPATQVAYQQEVIETFKSGLGFELTRAQRKAMWEAFQDMAKAVPMNRLLNGDVGSGKTAVAAACAAMAHGSGLQAVVMAPTEILARQHLHKFRAYLEGSFPGLVVELLVSSQNAAERRRVRAAAASGHCALIVGTHALIEEEV
jgi:ATP-dependent DNA helicase RecG